MIELTTQTAFAAYEAVRHRLPDVARQGTCTAAETLDDIAHGFDVLLLDAFGVLNIGETPIAGVPQRIAGLRAAGKRLVVVTNAASQTQGGLVAKFARLGYDFTADEIVSSRAALLVAMRAAPALHWGMMAPGGKVDADFDGFSVSPLADDPAVYATADAFALVGSTGWTEARQQFLETALTARPRPVWVGNPDIVAPRETGFSLEPGHFAHRLADRTGIAPEFFGKPFANVYDLALAGLGPDVDRARVLMVGDSLHTDVLGGQSAGMSAALVAGHGFFAGASATDAIDMAGIRPDFVLARP